MYTNPITELSAITSMLSPGSECSTAATECCSKLVGVAFSRRGWVSSVPIGRTEELRVLAVVRWKS